MSDSPVGTVRDVSCNGCDEIDDVVPRKLNGIFREEVDISKWKPVPFGFSIHLALRTRFVERPEGELW